MSKVPLDFGEWSEAVILHFTKNMRSNSKKLENLKKYEKFEIPIRKNMRNSKIMYWKNSKTIRNSKNSKDYKKFEKN